MAETAYTAYSYEKGAFMAVIYAFAQDAVDRAEPLTVAAAYAQCRAAALAESVIGAVGLEIESHLVDLDHVGDPVPWRRVEAIAAVVGKVAPGTAVTVEPGGQIELSGPPEAGVAPAVTRLRYEGTAARLALADRRLGLAYAGADPARPSRRVNPRPRYRAMDTPPGARTGRLAGAQFPGAAVYALPIARTIRPPDRAAAAGNDPGRFTMESSASAGRVASAVLARVFAGWRTGLPGLSSFFRLGGPSTTSAPDWSFPSRSSTCTRPAASRRRLRGWCWQRSWARRRSSRPFRVRCSIVSVPSRS